MSRLLVAFSLSGSRRPGALGVSGRLFRLRGLWALRRPGSRVSRSALRSPRSLGSPGDRALGSPGRLFSSPRSLGSPETRLSGLRSALPVSEVFGLSRRPGLSGSPGRLLRLRGLGLSRDPDSRALVGSYGLRALRGLGLSRDPDSRLSRSALLVFGLSGDPCSLGVSSALFLVSRLSGDPNSRGLLVGSSPVSGLSGDRTLGSRSALRSPALRVSVLRRPDSRDLREEILNRWAKWKNSKCIEACNLNDLGYTGYTFTWTNGRSGTIMCEVLIDSYRTVERKISRSPGSSLTSDAIDHAPIILTFDRVNKDGQQNTWGDIITISKGYKEWTKSFSTSCLTRLHKTIENERDAVYKDGSLGYGFVVRDSVGDVLLSGAKRTNMEGSSTLAEGLALIFGLTACRDTGLRQVMIECDCKILIDGLAGKIVPEFYGDLLIKDIRETGEEIGCCSFKHIPREANKLAHALAHFVQDHETEMFWVEELPPNLESIRVLDVNN
ncbi:hypothetical protein DH2020_038312 [Rehmannia glutinosa]|uniref:RNase H type-1 domain-containing protein n=1 Tax=Rehmannia glutinosa TaxID=99300 RepID=A0ABR0V162_REHGL